MSAIHKEISTEAKSHKILISSCNHQDSTTPLILSSAGGHTGCVCELLEQGADVNAKRVVRILK